MPSLSRRRSSSPGGSTPDSATQDASASGRSTQPSVAPQVDFTPASTQVETPFLDGVAPQQQAADPTHTVGRGENLTVIARRYGVEVKDLIAHNGIRNPNQLSVGQTLSIPSSRTVVADEVPTDTELHFVRRGENMSTIARQYGVTVAELAKANGITNVNFINVGQPLKIPSKGLPANAPRPTPRPEGLGTQTAPPAGDQQQGGQQTTQVSQDIASTTGIDAGQADSSQVANQTALDAVIRAVIGVAPKHDYAKGAIPGILTQCAASNVRNANQVAYILATADHESDFGKPLYKRSESLVEDSNPFQQNANGSWRASNHVSGRRVNAGSRDELETKYWDSAYGGKLGNRKGTEDASDFRGRGYVQLTGRVNYERMSRVLNAEGFTYEMDGVTWGGQGKPIDLARNPTHVNKSKELAARCLVEGMMDGLFTGSKLGNHVNDNKTDYYNARSVVNGDKKKNGRSIERTAKRYANALGSWSQVFQAPRQA